MMVNSIFAFVCELVYRITISNYKRIGKKRGQMEKKLSPLTTPLKDKSNINYLDSVNMDFS